MAFVFEWDAGKASRNLRKHGVSFDEASTVFDDLLASIFPDDVHSGHEKREILIGQSTMGGLLLVSFTERRQGGIRIISARRATRREQKDHEEQGIR
jgi:uncharacterized DUF497 family protein